jgi:hypothetical protein
MGLFTPFFRRERLRPERSAFPSAPVPLDPQEQRILDELRARREAEERRRQQEARSNG